VRKYIFGLFVFLSSALPVKADLSDAGDTVYDSDLEIFWLKDANMVKTACDNPASEAGVLYWGPYLIPPYEVPVNWGDNLTGSGLDKTTLCTNGGKLTLGEAVMWVQLLNDNNYLGRDDWRFPEAVPLNGSCASATDDCNSYDLTSVGQFKGESDTAYNIHADGTMYSGGQQSEFAHLHYRTLDNEGWWKVGDTAIANFPRSPPDEYCDDHGQYCVQKPGPFENIRTDTGNYYWMNILQVNGIDDPVNLQHMVFDVGKGFQGIIPSNIPFFQQYVWLVHSDGYPLAVQKDGSGEGEVTSGEIPPLINCGSDCFGTYDVTDPVTVVTLMADADPGSTFTGWTDCPSVQADETCQVPMDAARMVTATFSQGAGILTIAKTVTGGSDPDLNTFTIVLNCDDDSFDYPNIQLTHGATHTVDDIPAGTECWVREPALPDPPAGYGYGTPEITPTQPVTIVAGETAAVTVTNYLLGIDLEKRVYEGHDNGAGCATAGDSLTIVDPSHDGAQITYCFVVTNVGGKNLGDIRIDDLQLGIENSSTLPTVGGATPPLAPNGQLVYYYEVPQVVTSGGTNTATVRGTPTGESEVADSDHAELIYIFDPPFGYKTVTRNGAVLVWEMVWINDSPTDATSVDVFDEIPDGTIFDTLDCIAEGTSVTNVCEFQDATVHPPRGRIYWSGFIGSDPGATDADTANNEVVIRFETTIADPTRAQTIQNQGVSDWDMDGDGTDEFTDVLTGNSVSPPNQLPTQIIVGYTGPSIPTLQFWGLALLTVLLGLLGMVHRRRR